MRSCHLISSSIWSGHNLFIRCFRAHFRNMAPNHSLYNKDIFSFSLKVFFPNSQFKYLISISPGVAIVPDLSKQLFLAFYFSHFNSQTPATIPSTHSDGITVIFHVYATYTMPVVLSSYTIDCNLFIYIISSCRSLLVLQVCNIGLASK